MEKGSVNRRTVLRRTAATGVPLAATGIGTWVGGSETARAGEEDCPDLTYMDPGERYVMREADDPEGCCGRWTYHTDHNWGLTYIGEDGGDYEFAASAIFNQYRERGNESNVDPQPEQTMVKHDVEIDNFNQEGTNLIEETRPTDSDYKHDGESYSTVTGLAGSNWRDWFESGKGESSSKSHVREKWDDTPYGDKGDVPDWVSHIMFAAAVGASVASGGALAVIIGGTAFAVNAIDFVQWISDFDEDGTVYHGPVSENGGDQYYYDWDYGSARALTVSVTRFTVDMSEDETGDVRAKVFQSFEAGSSGYSGFYGTPNCGKWEISVPSRSGNKPAICFKDTYVDEDGHSRPQ